MSITGGDVVDLGRGPYTWLPPKRGRGTGLPEGLVATIGSECHGPDGPGLPGVLRVMADVAAVAHETEAACTGGPA